MARIEMSTGLQVDSLQREWNAYRLQFPKLRTGLKQLSDELRDRLERADDQFAQYQAEIESQFAMARATPDDVAVHRRLQSLLRSRPLSDDICTDGGIIRIPEC